jgi:hypothetical protein
MRIWYLGRGGSHDVTFDAQIPAPREQGVPVRVALVED